MDISVADCVGKELVCEKCCGTCEKSNRESRTRDFDFIELFDFMLVNLSLMKGINHVGPLTSGFVKNFRFQHCVRVELLNVGNYDDFHPLNSFDHQ